MNIYSYNTHSESAKALAKALGILRIAHTDSKYKGNENKLVINWGASSMPEEVLKSAIVNHPSIVKLVSNKIKFFELMKDKINLPDFTTDVEEAYKWAEEGSTVFLRSKINGHSGEGIQIFEPDQVGDFEHFKSWCGRCNVMFATKYIPKKEEYRVHVVNGEVIDVRRKVKKQGVKVEEWKIRSYRNGFVFQKDNINPHPDVLEQAVKAVRECKLNFGAVDVIWNNYREKAYVLEINTAPGLEGSTIEEYSKAFDKMFKSAAEEAKSNKKSIAQVIEEMQMVHFDTSTSIVSESTNNFYSSTLE